ncbi:MAG: chemotaxis protein CheC [bacterium]|nr:chemotaxis protein CheC [bacterium]
MAIKITEMQRSALQEAGNIGSGHSAIALSQLLGKKIMIAVPSVHIIELSRLDTFLNGTQKEIIQISLLVLGSVKGIIIFAIQEDGAAMLCDIVMGKPKIISKLTDEFQQSALREIGNIVAASYLNAVGEMTRLSLIVSTPDYNIGKIGLSEKFLNKNGISKEDIEDVLCIKTEFTEAATKVEGFLVFIPIGDAIKKIISALGV